ncbi:hypothetical protein Hanom_Chr01g00074821 [Helianthus anomalus]
MFQKVFSSVRFSSVGSGFTARVSSIKQTTHSTVRSTRSKLVSRFSHGLVLLRVRVSGLTCIYNLLLRVWVSGLTCIY